MYCEHCGAEMVYKKGCTPKLDSFDKITGKPIYKQDDVEKHYKCPYFECRNYETFFQSIGVSIDLIGFTFLFMIGISLIFGGLSLFMLILSIIYWIIVVKRHNKRVWLKKEVK